MPEHLIYLICGPTASGKSQLALERAQQHQGVILNADSLQFYHDLPLLTAQPSPSDHKKVPHRLYGSLSALHPMSAGLWLKLTVQEIKKVWADGRTPFVVGGTGFYLKALMDGLASIPDIPQSVRLEARRLMRELGPQTFHKNLLKVDPQAASLLKTTDSQRLTRAWEVFHATGRSIVDWQNDPTLPPFPDARFHVTFLNPPRETLYERCNQRFEKIIEMGALAEVKALLKKYPDPPYDQGVFRALGFHELVQHLQGHISLKEAITYAQMATRHYAKRQLTWFKGQIQADEILT